MRTEWVIVEAGRVVYASGERTDAEAAARRLAERDALQSDGYTKPAVRTIQQRKRWFGHSKPRWT